MNLQQAERLVRRLRQRIFDYYDRSEESGIKASRVLHRALAIVAKSKPARRIDEFGATASDRSALASHGIAWGD